MKSGHTMLNQIKRIWADKGKEDKDFSLDEKKLREALDTFRKAANELSRASSALLDMINSKA